MQCSGLLASQLNELLVSCWFAGLFFPVNLSVGIHAEKAPEFKKTFERLVHLLRQDLPAGLDRKCAAAAGL